MSKKESRQQKKLTAEKNLELLKSLGYCPVQQKAPWQYKDCNLVFYPTTGTYFDEYARLTGKISDLPEKSTLRVTKNTDQSDIVCFRSAPVKTEKDVVKPPKKYRYYNLDRRYLPDWVLDKNRQKLLAQIITRPEQQS